MALCARSGETMIEVGDLVKVRRIGNKRYGNTKLPCLVVDEHYRNLKAQPKVVKITWKYNRKGRWIDPYFLEKL